MTDGHFGVILLQKDAIFVICFPHNIILHMKNFNNIIFYCFFLSLALSIRFSSCSLHLFILEAQEYLWVIDEKKTVINCKTETMNKYFCSLYKRSLVPWSNCCWCWYLWFLRSASRVFFSLEPKQEPFSKTHTQFIGSKILDASMKFIHCLAIYYKL